MRQPNFFERESTGDGTDFERIVLYALGDFQARGKVLAGRDLPFDRLRGALRRATETFSVGEMEDEQVALALTSLGANVRRVPTFFAKHPFRVTVSIELAERAREVFKEAHNNQR